MNHKIKQHQKILNCKSIENTGILINRITLPLQKSNQQQQLHKFDAIGVINEFDIESMVYVQHQFKQLQYDKILKQDEYYARFDQQVLKQLQQPQYTNNQPYYLFSAADGQFIKLFNEYESRDIPINYPKPHYYTNLFQKYLNEQQ